jgi:cathepsin B
VASDNFCIGAKGEKDSNLVFSPQYLVDCDGYASGCSGANTINVIGWIKSNGIPLDTCYPYESGTTKKAGKCHQGTCTEDMANQEWSKFYFEDAQTWSKKSYTTIQEALLEGTVYFSMNVYSDFKSYTGGVYVKEKGAKKSGGHAVKAVGWGTIPDCTESDAAKCKYWLVANSWGPRWGEQGYFKIRFDQDIAYKAGTLKHKVNAEEATQ